MGPKHAQELTPSGFIPGEVEQLESSAPLKGGLILRSKPQAPGASTDEIPEPRTSVLGLDLLAERKRLEKRMLEESSAGQTDSTASKNYRQRRLDTPSEPGGLSDAARQRLQMHSSDKSRYRVSRD
eukprot:jgi/Hompol1/2731/HPOL_005718-RA